MLNQENQLNCTQKQHKSYQSITKKYSRHKRLHQNKPILLDPHQIQNPFSKTHETQKQLLLVSTILETQIGGDERARGQRQR